MKNSVFQRLYTGEGGLDFVGRRKTWYRIAAGVIVACVLAIALRGFSLSIEFEGGTKMSLPAGEYSTSQVAEVFQKATGVEPSEVQVVGAGDSRIMEIRSTRLDDAQINKAREELYDTFHTKDSKGKETPDVIGDSTVSESWGSTITNRMLLSLAVFLVLIFGYIAVRFERDMAIAAIAALGVDAIVVAGVYALIGFEVSPATVIGLLTVLAFSLYDTVVVFDKVKENTAGFEGSRRRTYAEQANLAVNQTVMRSISTTLFSALPIASLMVIAVWLMGVGTLKDLALVQLIGVIEGTFSSVFLATPILVSLKQRQRKVREHDKAVAAHRERVAAGDEDAVAADLAKTEVADLRGELDSLPDPREAEAVNGPTGDTWRPGQPLS